MDIFQLFPEIVEREKINVIRQGVISLPTAKDAIFDLKNLVFVPFEDSNIINSPDHLDIKELKISDYNKIKNRINNFI